MDQQTVKPLTTITFEHLISEKQQGHEDTKSSNFIIPATIKNEIKAYQKIFRAVNKTRITREHVLYKLIIKGIQGLREEAESLRQSL